MTVVERERRGHGPKDVPATMNEEERMTVLPERAITARMRKAEKAARYRAEVSVEKIARGFAFRYGVAWADLTPSARDAWRERVAELLRYVDSTGFPGSLPTQKTAP